MWPRITYFWRFSVDESEMKSANREERGIRAADPIVLYFLIPLSSLTLNETLSRLKKKIAKSNNFPTQNLTKIIKILLRNDSFL